MPTGQSVTETSSPTDAGYGSERKEIKLEATTAWYEKELDEGRGWEHIKVDGYECASKTLGIEK